MNNIGGDASPIGNRSMDLEDNPMEGAFIGGAGQVEEKKPAPPTPKKKAPPPMSFAEQIAAQAANLKKKGEVNKDAPIKPPKDLNSSNLGEADPGTKSFLQKGPPKP